MPCVVRDPETIPRLSASWNLKTYFAIEHAENERDRGRERAPQEQTDALRLQAIDEARTGGDADDRQ